MITRQWILAILWELPLWYWPVFFWEVRALQAWWATNPLEQGTMVTLGVTKTGRIEFTGYFPPEQPDPADWTRHAPRAPWRRLDPDTRIASFMAAPGALSALIRFCIGIAPSPHHGRTVAAPPFLDSG